MKLSRLGEGVYRITLTVEELRTWEAIAAQLDVRLIHLVFGLLTGGLQNLITILKDRR